MRILVLTSCTGDKAVSHPDQLTLDDFRQGPEHVARRERELGQLTRAEELYTGLQHQRLMQGVSALRERPGDIRLDLRILSAGYGLVPGERPLAPYEATFSGMRKRDLRAWADALRIPARVRELLAEPYDLALVLLGNEYLDACLLASNMTLGGPTLLFCGAAKAKSLPQLAQLRTVILSNPDAKRFSLTDGSLAFRYDFPPETGPVGSFLNDLAVDDERWFVYIADVGGSHTPVLVWVDTNTKISRRFTKSPALKAEDVDLVVEDRVIGVQGEDAKLEPARIAVNPITLSADGEVLYFTDLANNAITKLGSDGRLETLVQDARLLWPDALSFGEPGWLYIAVNQLQRAPALNGGVEGAEPPFRILRVYTGTTGIAGR